MCCSGAKWKREVVQDHKFDFVDVHEYHTTGFITRFRYALVYVLVIKSVGVYIADIYTCIAMLANNYWSGNILAETDESSTISVPFTIGKWIFTGCIIFSFLLLAWESRKARMIIRSRDISYAFTNVMANDYYCLKSYDHFCFFSQINNSKKKKDEFAFFVFFTFKGWKRLLLADAPRQVINGLTLYSFGKAFNFTTDLSVYYNGSDGKFSFVRAGVLCTMIFTVVIWVGSAILLAIAAIMYIPLLCYIQGNLKEYCCHKIDKRIAELMKRKTKKRLAREAELAKREAAGDFRHLQDKRGKFKEGARPLPQPTLPTIDLGDEELYSNYGGESKSEVGSSAYHAQKGSARNPYAGNYPTVPSVPDLAFNGGYPDQYQRYQLQDGQNPSEYSMYPYPNSQSQLQLHHNDSFVSFDDKASIKSKDPLMTANVYPQSGTSASGDHSQISLGRAPSYKTQEDSVSYNIANQHGYTADHHYPYGNQHGYYEPDPQHPYAEPPYAMDDDQLDHRQDPHFQQYEHHGYPLDEYEGNYPPQQLSQRTSNSSSNSRPRDGSANQNSHLSQPTMSRTPAAIPRGVSVAGRSDVTTFYYMEDRDRASMADSHAGAFDLDDYARQSMFGNSNANGGLHPNSQWQNQMDAQRGSRLEYLEEQDEEEYDYRDSRHAYRGNAHPQQGQQEWSR